MNGTKFGHVGPILILSLLSACASSDKSLKARLDFRQDLLAQEQTQPPSEINDPSPTWNFTGKSGELLFVRREDTLNENQFFESANRKVLAIQQVLSPGTDPYFGAHNSGPTCLVSALPKVQAVSDDHQRQLTASFFASATLAVGSCSEQEDIFKVQYLWLRCSQRNELYELRFYYPKNQDWLLEPIAHCHVP